MKSMIASIGSSDEKPAACRCPPPPDWAAIADTSTSSWLERSEIRRAGPSLRGGSRVRATLSQPPTPRREAKRASEDGPPPPAEGVVGPRGVRPPGPAVAKIVLERGGDDEPTPLEQLRPLERPSQ